MWRRIKQKMLQQALVYMRPVLKPQTLQQPRYHSARVEAGFSPETYKWRDCLCAVVWFWWLAAALCQRCQRRRSLTLSLSVSNQWPLSMEAQFDSSNTWMVRSHIEVPYRQTWRYLAQCVSVFHFNPAVVLLQSRPGVWLGQCKP